SRRLNASNLFLSLILHLGNLFLIVQLHFSKLFLILKSGVNHTSRRSEERFSRNAETDLVCRLLLEKKKRRSIMSCTHHCGACNTLPVSSASTCGPQTVSAISPIDAIPLVSKT